LAGLCGGLLAALVGTVAGEPPLDRAIQWEASHPLPGAHHHAEIVSRSVQSAIGLPVGAILYGIALGGAFALVFAAVYGRVSRSGPARTSIGLATAAFVVVYVAPFVKYPANPPSIGHPDTIGTRSSLYASMIAISVLAAVAALRLRRDLVSRTGEGAATLCAVGAYLAVVFAASLALPGVHEVPATFPATVLWDFRVAAMGVQIALWATIGLVFGAAAQRVIEPVARPDRATARAGDLTSAG
jgi:uncharacterized membrane protein YidH (DUF202 family)